MAEMLAGAGIFAAGTLMGYAYALGAINAAKKEE